jgi:hypothetical protein
VLQCICCAGMSTTSMHGHTDRTNGPRLNTHPVWIGVCLRLTLTPASCCIPHQQLSGPGPPPGPAQYLALLPPVICCDALPEFVARHSNNRSQFAGGICSAAYETYALQDAFVRVICSACMCSCGGWPCRSRLLGQPDRCSGACACRKASFTTAYSG